MGNKIIFYQNQDSNIVVNVTYFEDNFWLTQKLIAQLFGCSVDNVALHLKNIFASEELNSNSVTEDFSATKII